MVEGMGGQENFKRFKSYCGQAYNIIRKSANLILNLLKLMLDAGINDLGPPDLLTVQDKFRLELNDEEAERVFHMLIDECVSAILPEWYEMIHKVAVYIK
jgi:phosphatidylinositol 3-kinase